MWQCQDGRRGEQMIKGQRRVTSPSVLTHLLLVLVAHLLQPSPVTCTWKALCLIWTYTSISGNKFLSFHRTGHLSGFLLELPASLFVPLKCVYSVVFKALIYRWALSVCFVHFSLYLYVYIIWLTSIHVSVRRLCWLSPSMPCTFHKKQMHLPTCLSAQ